MCFMRIVVVPVSVSTVIAESFSRIFCRNAINFGLLVITCPEAVRAIAPGETVTVDLENHTIRCAAGSFSFPPMRGSVRQIVEAGGLIEYVKRKLAAEG